jgi:hypothetical protein
MKTKLSLLLFFIATFAQAQVKFETSLTEALSKSKSAK